MKIIGLLLVGLLSTAAMADTSRNPDQRTSLGVDVSDTYTGVTLGPAELYDSKDNTTTFYKPKSDLHVTQLLFDVRAPITNDITFTMHGGPNTSEFFGEKRTGYSVGGGFRFYLPKY